jgi:anti-sigma regulatory factor (Ser/Thr protein kinase)
VTGAQVVGDRSALDRVVANLLDNAVRHAASRVSIELQDDGAAVTPVVADNGPGVPPQDRERVFERFVSIDDDGASERGGAGLGLAIVRDVVQAHNGTVHIEDNQPGARVVVVLPHLSDLPPSVDARLGVRVGDLVQRHKGGPQLAGPPTPEVGDPLLLYLVHRLRRDGAGPAAPCREGHQPSAAIGRVGDPAHITSLDQLIDQEARGLLRHLSRFGQLGEARSGRSDALEHPCLRERDVVEAGRSERVQHSGLHGPVGDEQQYPEIRFGHEPSH